MSDAATGAASPSGSTPAEAGRRVAAQTAAAPDHDASYDGSEPLKKKQKKTRSSMSKVRGRRGALKAFNSLPLDLVLDICSYLDPADLYVLSNTSKVFRAVVTGPSSAQLWIDARARVGLPELQLPMSDLQYAALLFGRGCQFCDRKNAGKPEVYFRARICSACLKSEFVCPDTPKGVSILCDVAPRAHVGTILLAASTNPHSREGRLIHLTQIIKLDRELKEAFPEANYVDSLFLETLLHDRYGWREAGEPVNPFQKWVVDTRKPVRYARRADGDALTQWLKTQELAKVASKSDIRSRRKADLEVRFKAQGFGSADFIREWQNDPLVKKPELLTERTWARAEPILREKLNGIRTKARTDGMRSCFVTASRQRPVLTKMGFTAQVAVTLPTVVRLVADNSTSAAGWELFNANVDAILDEAVAVVASRMQEMIRLVAAAHAEVRQDREQAVELSDAMEGLDYKSVDLPRLPSWIPRNRETPIDADPEQMFAFLDSHALSAFRCRKCNGVFSGGSAAQHVLHFWNQCMPSHHYDPDEVDVNEWMPIGGTGPYGFDTDARTLLRTLKLNQLANSIELECSDKTYKDSGLRHGINLPEEEMYVVRFDRKCDCGFSKGHDLSSTNSYLSKHWATKPGHQVTVTPVVDYSATFRHKVDAADARDAYDYLGLGMFDNDSYSEEGFGEDYYEDGEDYYGYLEYL